MDLSNLEKKLMNVVHFWEENYHPTSQFNLLGHQISRIYEIAFNGHKRILCEDATGAGKTLTSLAVKKHLDQRFGRTTKAIVFSPLEAIKSAWSQEKLNFYFDGLKIPSQETRVILTPEDRLKMDTPITLMNYEKLGFLRDFENNKYREALLEMSENYDLLIFDEAHNLKTLSSTTNKAIRELIEKTKDKPALLLSATIIPNKLADVGFMLYMLDPVKFEYYSNNKFVYNLDKTAIKDLINERRWLRFSRQDLKEIFSLPELTETPHYIQISDEHALKYFDSWKKEMNMKLGLKLDDLRKITYASKLEGLDALLTNTSLKVYNDQILIFTALKEGVIDPIKNVTEKNIGPTEIITGDTPLDKRITLAKAFTNGKIRGLVTTKAMSEGISLSTKERPLSIIIYEPELTLGDYDQEIGRGYRPEQKAPVRVFELIAKNYLLTQLMTAELPRLEEQFETTFKEDWSPTTLDEDRYHKRLEKQKIFCNVVKGYTLNEMQQLIANLDDSSPISETIKIFTPQTTKPKKEHSPNKILMEGAKAVRDSIGKGIDHLESNPKKNILVTGYNLPHEDYLRTNSAEVNRIISEIIKGLEKKEGNTFERILDAGSGSACLARVLGRPIYNLDQDREMLENGKNIATSLGIYNTSNRDSYFIQAYMQKIPVVDHFFNLISCSHAFQYNGQGYENKRDLENILLEFNKKTSTYLILGLTYPTTKKKDFEEICKALPLYGFKPEINELVRGNYHHEDMKDIPFNGVYLVVAKKIQEKTMLADEKIIAYNPSMYAATGGYRKSELFEQGKTMEEVLGEKK